MPDIMTAAQVAEIRDENLSTCGEYTDCHPRGMKECEAKCLVKQTAALCATVEALREAEAELVTVATSLVRVLASQRGYRDRSSLHERISHYERYIEHGYVEHCSICAALKNAEDALRARELSR